MWLSLLAHLVVPTPVPPPVTLAHIPPLLEHRITILYDAFGARRDLTRDWGFAALIEYGGKRILFDTGNNARVFERNVRRLGIDLGRLDFAVVSHRHGDHTSGLSYLLRVNPSVTIYAPREGFGVFGAALPASFLHADSALPDSMRYYGGRVPDEMRFGTPWPDARFTWIDSVTQIAPGVVLISTVSSSPGTLELRELSLGVQTPEGLLLVVGCSHPGIETIIAAAERSAGHVHQIVGGLHLVTAAESQVARVAGALHDRWQIDLVAPGHCTGEPAFDALKRIFGARYRYAGLGTRLPLP